MVAAMDDVDPRRGAASPPKAGREARLARALRDNLRRRKQPPARGVAAELSERDPSDPGPLADD